MLSRYTSPARRRSVFHKDDGLSLIEVMIAMFVLSIAVLALASTAATAVTSLRISRERQQATVAASAAIEEARSYPYRDIGHPPDTVTAADPYVTGGASPYQFAHNGTDYEDLIVTNGGRIDPHVWQDGRITVRLYATWYDDPDIPSSPHNARRLTAIATWSDPAGGEREVRQSTIVGEAGRGLPVPKFDIDPDELTQSFAGVPFCFVHILRNLGATDSYDWQLYRQGGNPAQVINDHTYRAHGWRAHAWWGEPQYNADGTPDTSAPNLWKRGTDQPRPTSPWAVESGEWEILTICYRPVDPNAQGHSQPNVSVVIRSAFDSQIDQTIHHQIIKNPQPNHTLYLWPPEPDDNGEFERVLEDDIYALSPVEPIFFDDQGDPDDTLHDYDPNLDPDDLPGLYLRPDDMTYAGIWTYNGFSPGTEIDRGTLTLYLAWPGAHDGGGDATLTVGFLLDVVSGSTGDVLQTSQPVSFTYTHDEPGWMQRSADYTINVPDGNGDFIPGRLSFPDSDHHLRLRVWCVDAVDADGSPTDCHLAFGANNHRSHILLVEPSS
jgi:prepilin-type N-terminal cleavage/methylation domain-containing protein